MRRLYLILVSCALAVLASSSAPPLRVHAQTTVATHISTGGTLPASCRVGDVFYKTGASAGLYNATAIGPCTWALVAASSVGAGGAPDNAQYWTGAADGTLSAEKNLGGFTGIVLNTAGTPTAATAGVHYATVTYQAPVGLRLSLTTNVYITSADVTAATDLYWTTVLSGGTGVVTCYNGSALARSTITQQTIALGTLTADKNYNVYWDCDGAALAFGAAWTNDTTPSETIADEQGAEVLSSDHTKLYIGIFRTTTTTTTEDSKAKRFVWNRHNQTLRFMSVVDLTDSWNYTTAAFRQARATTTNQLDFVTGDASTVVQADVHASHSASNASSQGHNNIGLDSTTTASGVAADSTHQAGTSATTIMQADAYYKGIPGIGRHILVWLEGNNVNVGTTTWYGDAGGFTFLSGISGTIWN